MRQGGLESVEAVVERQQRMPAERDDDGFILHRQDGGPRRRGTGWVVCDGVALLPLGDILRIGPVAFRQRPQACLTMLDRATDCLCRGGAPVQNLAHSVSFTAWEKTAPSNPGIKHLEVCT
jgi:hypothetical protein